MPGEGHSEVLGLMTSGELEEAARRVSNVAIVQVGYRGPVGPATLGPYPQHLL